MAGVSALRSYIWIIPIVQVETSSWDVESRNLTVRQTWAVQISPDNFSMANDRKTFFNKLHIFEKTAEPGRADSACWSQNNIKCKYYFRQGESLSASVSVKTSLFNWIATGKRTSTGDCLIRGALESVDPHFSRSRIRRWPQMVKFKQKK